jgi:hypothetical protein
VIGYQQLSCQPVEPGDPRVAAIELSAGIAGWTLPAEA